MTRPMYTMTSDEGHRAVVEAQPKQGYHYPMNLAPSDFKTVVDALLLAANGDDEELADRALSMYSAIAETLGVDLV